MVVVDSLGKVVAGPCSSAGMAPLYMNGAKSRLVILL